MVCAILAAAILALAKVVPAWGSALTVGGVLFAISAALGRKQVRRATPPVPRQTVASERYSNRLWNPGP